ncbi:hypothetical protein LWI29_000400 [Acer saccharum]|uniref:Uncharacterized protein n=1 Tax=Acer saccharum TaxID=4024 RepID=A0AA39SSD7_ACESA|nr:hypothetical protein LWI29_000400 [Acer saccharum]
MEAYKPILSTSAKNGRKIRKNEAFSLVLRFRPWPCAHFGLAWAAVCTLWPWHGSRVHTLALAWASRVHTLALAWADFGLGRATRVHTWPWHGKPCAHFGLGMAAMCTLWPWHGQAMCTLWPWHGLILALAVHAAVCTLWAWHGQPCTWPWHGQPCAHFGLGIGQPVHTLALAWGKPCHTLALARADFGLGRATLASEKKKKSFSEFAQFCMEAYKLILSTSAKNGSKIRNNEVFSLVLRFRPWPCAHFGLAWAAVCTLWPWHGQPWHTLALA